MKSADEIIAMILGTITRIYERPAMYASGSDGVEDVLWHLHLLWLRGMGFEMDRLHWALDRVEDAEHRGAMNFPTFYRDRRRQADDAEVVRYVVRMWREVDERLGIELPTFPIEAPRP
jgi:hypothetical protein